MFIKNKIQQIVKKAILETQRQGVLPKFEVGEILVVRSEKEMFGDYTTNVAMRISKLAKLAPQKVAEVIVNRILSFSEMKDMLCRVEVKTPGFINITLERSFLLKELEKILREKEKYGALMGPKRNRVQVEFISANPTGKLHIGHGRGAFFGDVLANVLKKAGYKVRREYYINDSKESGQIKALGELVQGKENSYKTKFVARIIEEIQNPKSKIQNSGELGYLLAQKIQTYNRQFIEQKLKIHFDVWFSEENLRQLGGVQKTINWLETFGFLYKKDGALWFKTIQFGDDKDRVLIRKNGEATYFLSDIVYHRDKFERFDKIIDIWGADHHGYINRMKAVAAAMGRKEDLDILIAQLVRLVKNGKEFKMSKRKGQVVDLEWLIDEVGLEVARFFYLMKSLDCHMDFDLDRAKDISEKNPVFYIQYAYARICSILKKTSTSYKLQAISYLEHPAELSLIRELIKFPELIEEISKNYSVHHLPAYAISLADKFHNFYEKCRVLSDDKKLTLARLSLILAVKIVLKNVLNILGVRAKEKM
ncbi:MAG: arginine--tRNA ligase [Patescibacteria group bacterium]